MRLPIRARLTLVSGGLIAVLLLALGAFLYFRLQADLTNAVDAGLRSRAQALLRGAGRETLPGGGVLIETDEAFAQVLGPDGRVLESSRGLPAKALLSSRDVGELRGPRFFESETRINQEAVPGRFLAVRAADGRVFVVGASLEEQHEAVSRLLILLAVGGPVALAMASGVGWLVAGAALRPVERMRIEAEAVSASEPGRRLPVPGTGDELARLGETLNRMLGRLEDAVERERRFVSDASHELRTPLANLKAELELALRRSRTPEELAGALRSAAEETERLTRLAEDLLILARMDGGRLPLRREDLDIGDLVRDIVGAFSGRASERGIFLESRFEDGIRARVDPMRLRQAVGNLLDNAFRYTDPGGRVTVDLTQLDGTLSIEVADTGVGIPPTLVAKLLQPFSRADALRGPGVEGTGLGLAIVRAVAEAHGGAVEAGNRAEGGAVVVLRLPAG